MNRARIEEIADDALNHAKKILKIEDVHVVIEEAQDATIPETGVGGFTPDSNTIIISIDSSNKNLLESLEQKIRSAVTHECHHAVRNRFFDWKTDTLLGAMVTEGLADHFDIEVNGGVPQLWAIALTGQELDEWERKASAEYNSEDYDHDAWFFGSKDTGIPRWSGYSLGFKIVGDYMNSTGKKASELVSNPPTDFI